MVGGPDLQLRKPNKFLPQYFGIVITLITIIILLGWQFDIQVFVRSAPGLGAAHPLVAIGLLAMGLLFITKGIKNKGAFFKAIDFVLPFVPILIGASKLAELFFKFPFHIDTLIYSSKLAAFGYQNVPDHITACTAFELVLTGMALLGMNFKGNCCKAAVNNMALLIVMVAFMSFMSCIYLKREFYIIVFYTAMAISVGFCFILSGLAIMFSLPDWGFMAAFNRTDSGRLMSRIFIPVSIIIPVVFGFVTLYVIRSTTIAPAAWTSLLVIALIFSQFFLTWYIGAEANKNAARKLAEEQLRKSEYYYRSIIEQASDAIIIATTKGDFLEVNSFTCDLFGYTNEELLKLNIRQLVEPEQLRINPLVKPDMLLTGQNFIKERRMVHKSGATIETRVNVKMLPDGRVLTFIHDITEEKREEIEFRNLFEQLQISEAKYRSLIEQASDAIWVIDFNGNFIEVNASLCNMLGYTKEELLPTHVSILVDSDQLKVTPLNFDLPDDGRTILKEWRMRRKDSTIITAEWHVKRISDNRIMSIARDITELRKVQKQVKESEARFRTLAENNFDAITLLDSNFKPIYRSPSATRVTGWSDEERKTNYGDDMLHPDDIKRVQETYKKIKESEGVPFLLSYRIKHKNGNYIWVDAVVRNMLSDTDIGAIVLIMRDITARKNAEQEIKKSEEKYRHLFEINPMPMWMSSLTDFKIIDVNEAAVEHYGYSRDEFIGMNLKDMRPSEDVEDFLKSMNKDRDGVSYRGTWRHKKKNGDLINVEIFAHEIVYDGKNARLILVNDVTEKLQAEEELRQMNEQLRHFSAHLQDIREEERTHISREIHDELGQLLTGLKIDVSWLSKKLGSSSEEVSKRIHEMLHLTDRTIQSVRRITTELRPGILDDLGLGEAITWHSNEFESKTGIVCEVTGDLKNKKYSTEVSTAAFRILQESLTNVMRHANAKHVVIKMQENKDALHLEIIDDGIGIANDKKIGGNSLGIMGMRERASIIGGSFTISSVPLKGTRVKVEIPFKPQSQNAR